VGLDLGLDRVLFRQDVLVEEGLQAPLKVGCSRARLEHGNLLRVKTQTCPIASTARRGEGARRPAPPAGVLRPWGAPLARAAMPSKMAASRNSANTKWNGVILPDSGASLS